jgi:argininosuccinate lyase
MPQKRNPCSLEVIKAKASFAHGMLVSLLSVGKALFMGFNRDTQWTKYWIMDLVDESKPVPSVMTDVIRLLEVNKAQMLKQAQEEFLGATALMEWLVLHGPLPMRKAKMVMERAVKYSEKEGKGKVSYQSLRKALREMKINLPVTERDVERNQRPEKILVQTSSAGTPSGRRIKENIASLRKKVQANKAWLIHKRKEIEKAKALNIKMEKQLGR